MPQRRKQEQNVEGLTGCGQHRKVVHPESFARLRAVRDLISQRHAEPLSLAEIAECAGYSPFHFQRQFVRAFGQSPSEFLTDVRLKRAQELLRSSDLTVTDVCLEVGYFSLPTFSALFSRQMGCPPTEFRRVFSVPGMWTLKCVPACYRAHML